MDKKIKLFSPSINDKEIEATETTIKSLKWASGVGDGNVSIFENNLKKYFGSNDCIVVNSGTAALQLSMNILDVKFKEVLVPSLTFVSTVHSIVYNGGIPVFVDVDPKTLCIDTQDLEIKFSEKTKAIIPVHFGGYPADLEKIEKFAKKKSIHVVEDAAHACGSKYAGKNIGSRSEMVCFSFHPVKNLAVPKGGAISVNTKNFKNIRKRLNSLRWCGISNRKKSFYDITDLGNNFYMDEISAAIGIEQLKKLDKLNKIRVSIAKRYYEELKFDYKMPFKNGCSYHLYWIVVNNRKKFIEKMELNGIETGTHYLPVHLMKYYKSKIKLPITEKIGKEIVTLPIHANLSEKQVDKIIKISNKIKNDLE